jgi:hypothetical protein
MNITAFDPAIQRASTDLKYPFNNLNLIEKSASQAGQELFALTVLDGKKNGVYVEIGANHPTFINNTFLLEEKFNWAGVSYEIDKGYVETYNSIRKNKCVQANCLAFDFRANFKELELPTQIDYLSLDIEPASNTYEVLTKLPHDEYRFSVITFEHDFYRFGDEVRRLSRDYLHKLNYKLLVKDVTHLGNTFEDWWVDPLVIKTDFSCVPHRHVDELFFKTT